MKVIQKEEITVIVKLTNNAFSKSKKVLIEEKVKAERGKISAFNFGSLELLVVIE